MDYPRAAGKAQRRLPVAPRMAQHVDSRPRASPDSVLAFWRASPRCPQTAPPGGSPYGRGRGWACSPAVTRRARCCYGRRGRVSREEAGNGVGYRAFVW